jgi:hypothetical protein
MAKRKRSAVRTAVFAVSAVAIVATSAVVLYLFTADNKPVVMVNRAEVAKGTVLVPDHKGTCDKFTISNDTGKSVYEGTAPCSDNRPLAGPGSALPPALRGMQKSLGAAQ